MIGLFPTLPEYSTAEHTQKPLNTAAPAATVCPATPCFRAKRSDHKPSANPYAPPVQKGALPPP